MKHCIHLFVFIFFLQGCTSQPKKINGVSYVASGDPTTQGQVQQVINLNANYAAVMPFAFIRDLINPTLSFNTDRQWYGERREGVQQYIEMFQKNNIGIMMKPQIWIRHGEFTGYLKMTSEEDWKTLEQSYREFILLYAELAEETNVEIFCIGTELEQFIAQRPTFWEQLILEVKQVFKGKLTYAANWDEYKRVPFWQQLDFIGVDGYFPVSNLRTPTVEDAQKGWQGWKSEMMTFSEQQKRPILFTEYGYRSVDYSGKEPWKSDRKMEGLNLEAQNNLYNAFFTEIYPEPWFAGGFIWKWFIDDAAVGGPENTMFTPQNKPVEHTIQQHFEKEAHR